MRACLLIGGFLLLLLAATSRLVEPRQSLRQDDDAPDYSWVPIVEPGEATVPDPPGGRWLVDQNGREYTLFRWEKHEGYYRFESEDQRLVRLRPGLAFTVEHHDDRFLYLRWYRSEAAGDRSAAGASTGFTADADADAPAGPAPTAREPVRQDALLLVPWDEGLPRSGQWRNGFAVADVDGDGHLDLAHGPPRKGGLAEPVIFLGDGAGRWRPFTTARFPPLPYDYGDIAAGDLDGDGRMDLVLAVHNTGLFALYGDGRGGFASRSEGLPRHRQEPESTPPAALGGAAVQHPRSRFSSRAIALADWDRDGRLDILALAEGPSSVRDLADGALPLGKVVFRNRGDSGWEAVNGPGALMGDAILVADLDGDGLLDFVTDSRVVGSAELLNFGLPDGGWRTAALPDPRPRLRVRAVALADFDADGRLDLALAWRAGYGGEPWWGLDVYFAMPGEPGAPTWRRSSIWAAPDHGGGEGLTALAAGDLDADGDADLVALDAEGGISLLVNDGTGSFALDPSPEAEPGPEHRHCAGYRAAIVDLDRDGRGEVVAAFAGEPGSETIFGGTRASRCRARGALRVWKVSGPAARDG
ncbi:MAG TPA: VCBS repeat-containing protein [Thermoanaerobaculia bacterium]|nr:VCBS repeat-containing protein [Thermoanaerobaculia bacterium]